MRSFFYSVLRGAAVSAATQCFFDFLVGFVLAQGIDRPDRCWHPADQCDLQKQAQQARKRAANGEKHGKGQKQSKQQAHGRTGGETRKSRRRRPQSSIRQPNRGCLGSSRRQGCCCGARFVPEVVCGVHLWHLAQGLGQGGIVPTPAVHALRQQRKHRIASSTCITGQPKAALAAKHKRGNKRFS